MSRRAVTILALGALLLTSCAGEESQLSVEDTVRTSVAAENAKDVNTFLDLWTDKGLSEYDVGTRRELEAGKSENFGADKATLLRFVDRKVKDGEATATLDVTLARFDVVQTVYRITYELIRRRGKWLVNGFKFKGSPPPDPSAEVVEVEADEYSFAVDPSEAPDNLAFKFSNAGEEAHELTFFKGPDGVDLEEATDDLEDVDGEQLHTVPSEYKVDHLSFVEPGESLDITFAEPLASGTYVLACYLPEGGLDDEGEPVDPEGKPHIQLGMIDLLTVR